MSCARKDCCKKPCRVAYLVKLLLIVGAAFVVYLLFFSKVEVVGVVTPSIETGSVIAEATTGSVVTGSVNTGTVVEEKEEIIVTEEDYISYAIRSNYHQQFRLPKQYLPGATRDINNPIMWKYLNDNTYSVDMSNVTGGYIIFTMQRPITQKMLNKSIFFAINGDSKGAVNMKNRVELPNLESWYGFDIEDMKTGGYATSILKQYVKNNKLVIGAHAGENNNQIISIIFVPKNR